MDRRTLPTWVVEWDSHVTDNHGLRGGSLQPYGHKLAAAERMCTPDEIDALVAVRRALARSMAARMPVGRDC